MNQIRILLALAIVVTLAATAGAQTAPPVLTPIGPQAQTEGVVAFFTIIL